MGTKIIIALLVLVGGVAVWSVVAQRALSNEVERLRAKVAALESPVQEAAQTIDSCGERHPLLRSGRIAPEVNHLQQNPQDAGQTPIGQKDLGLDTLKGELREDLATMVEQSEELAHQKRREERAERWRQAMLASVVDFAEDNQVDGEIVEQMKPLLEESHNLRRQLRGDMDAQNISFYEYRQETRQNREELEAQLQEMLSPKQFEAFVEAFPGRGRR